MDIVITLPKDLWLKIVSGEKQYEMRKWSLPKHFDVNSDCIYVVIKGTRRIAGCFKVMGVEGRLKKDEAWLEFGGWLCVSHEWFSKYWENHFGFMYFFTIGDCIVSSHLNVEVPYAPQRYFNVTERIKSTSTGFYILKHQIS